MKTTHLLFSLAVGAPFSVQAATIVSADFSSYANGALVGQNGWQQFGTATTAPITVAAGKVTLPSILTATVNTDNQDAVLPFSSAVATPTTGALTYYFGLQLSVGAAGASPSYFAALNTLTTTTTTSNFANVRIGARDNGNSTFSFATRLTGQAGYAWAFGSALTYGTVYNILAEVTLNAGVQNDSVKLYVAPSTADLVLGSVYATSQYGTGTAADPASLGAIVISQFASATAQQSAVSFNKVIFADSASDVQSFLAIPEPSTFSSLAGLGALFFCAARRRRST